MNASPPSGSSGAGKVCHAVSRPAHAVATQRSRSSERIARPRCNRYAERNVLMLRELVAFSVPPLRRCGRGDAVGVGSETTCGEDVQAITTVEILRTGPANTSVLQRETGCEHRRQPFW